jgi:hypothetical protein
MKRNFQTLVVVHQLLVFASTVVQSVTDGWLPPELQGYLDLNRSLLDDARGDGSPFDTTSALWWVMTLASLAASAGVLFFRRWGRTLFVAVAAVGVLLVPIGGLYVDVGWTVMLSSLAGLCEGALIALMYFSPLRKMFVSARGAEAA